MYVPTCAAGGAGRNNPPLSICCARYSKMKDVADRLEAEAVALLHHWHRWGMHRPSRGRSTLSGRDTNRCRVEAFRQTLSSSQSTSMASASLSDPEVLRGAWLRRRLRSMAWKGAARPALLGSGELLGTSSNTSIPDGPRTRRRSLRALLLKS